MHALEVKKIKALAAEFAEENNISVEAAEARLLAQAQQNVDKTFAVEHSMSDASALEFLKGQSQTFVDESGRLMLMFAPGGLTAYEDSSMYVDTWKQFTSEYQSMLSAASRKNQTEKEKEILSKTKDTAIRGLWKGAGNLPSDAVNGLVDTFKQLFHLDDVGKEIVKVPFKYDTETEHDVAKGTQQLIDNALQTVGAAWASIKVSPVVKVPDTVETTRLWRAVEPEELADILKYGDYNIHPNSTFKRFGFDEKSLDDFIKANPDRTYTKTYIEIPKVFLDKMYRHDDPGGAGKAIGIDVYEFPEFYDLFNKVHVVPK